MPATDDAQRRHRRELAAERMRRTRERRRNGCICAYVDVHRSEIAELVRRGLLPADQADNPYAIGEAVGTLVGQALP